MSDMDIDFYESEDPIWNPALLAIPMPGIRKMVNLAATMDDVIHLSIGQPDLLAPRHVVDATVDALHAGQTGYTMDAGLPEPLIRMNGGSVKSIATRAENNHQLDPQEVIDAMDQNTCAVVLNSPSNPTGTVYPRETIEAIVEEAAYRGIYVISDEVYDHLIYDGKTFPSVLSCCSDLDHVMVVSSFSKTFSMAGMRVGWLIASQGAIRKLRRYHMFTTTVARLRT